MKTNFLSVLFLILFGTAWPGYSDAEIIRWPLNQHLTIIQKLSNPELAGPEVKNLGRWKHDKTSIIKQVFQKWKGRHSNRAWLILAVVLLFMVGFIAGMYGGFGLVVIAIISALGESGNEILSLLLLCIGLLTLSVLCFRGAIKIIKKLRKAKRERMLPGEEFPPRPPSKNLKPH